MTEIPYFHIVLVHPSIPLNTGSISRLAVCTGCRLHLIEPLGFSLEESRVKRAGLDYWKYLDLKVHSSWKSFWEQEIPPSSQKGLHFFSTKGKKNHYQVTFQMGDYLVFGNETHGLPPSFYTDFQDQLFSIPMPGEHSRTLNLANAVSIVVYEGLRQILYSRR
ncbi:MAG: tRNA (cytidine(34)-2'-O)-methyltransferase [Planctomycetota bacterium]|nr:MAG: tRNA (cytidine(34)-2'-O)-methyltransferase [Planctomycetota bacterium]